MAGPATLDLPRPFGPYELVRQLGVGGMAEVYVARARSVAGFEKVVALKMIHPRLSTDPEFTQLLVEEAKITAQLSHRNIVQLIDLGQVDNTHYIAMEFVDGLDLNKLINIAKERRMPLSPRVAAFIAREVCDALEHAHKKMGSDGKPLKLVHRDVSPPNILIGTSGEVKLTDFGIAKASMRASKTGVGVVKGKYAYMAPEQAKAQPVDHRADVFALGCVLYELAVGKPVYPDAAFPIMLDRVARAVFEAPEKAKPTLPAQLVKIIKTSLAAKADDRYASARAMADALTEFLFTLPPNPEAELSALIGEFVDGPATPSVPPMGMSDSILDDDFDDSTQIESVAVMKSRMVAPNALKGAPTTEKPGFRDEPTKAFKRVDDGQSANQAPEEEEPTAAIKGMPDLFAPKPSQQAATLAPPPRPSAPEAQPEARVRSPGAAQKNLRVPGANSIAPPVPTAGASSSAKANRDAPTMAPPSRTASAEMPAIPKAGKAPSIGGLGALPTTSGPSVKTPALPVGPSTANKPHAPQLQARPLPAATNAPVASPALPPKPASTPTPSSMPAQAFPPAQPLPQPMPQQIASQPTPHTAQQPAMPPVASPHGSGAFIASLNAGYPQEPAPATMGSAPMLNSVATMAPMQPIGTMPPNANAYDPFAAQMNALDALPAEPTAKPSMLPVLLAGGFALLGLVVLLVVWLMVGR